MTEFKWWRTSQAPRRAGIAVVLTAVIALAGCGTVKLHSDVREKQGEDAKKAWSEVDLKAYFDTERENLAKLLQEEIDSGRRLAAVRRENEIRSLAGVELAKLGDRYSLALVGLVVGEDQDLAAAKSATAAIVDAQAALDRESAKRYDLERSQSFLKGMGVPDFSCPQLAANPAVDLNKWKDANKDVAKKAAARIKITADLCKETIEAQETFESKVELFKGGSILDVYQSRADVKKALDGMEREAAARKTAYLQALGAYQAAVEAAKPGNSITAEVKDKAKQAADALKLLEDIQTALGVELASQERLKHLDDLLSGLQAGSAADVETRSKAELVALLLPNIAESARQVVDARKGANLVSLLIQRDIEQANLRTAMVQVAIHRKRLVLREAMLRASVTQAYTLVRARTFIDAAITCPESMKEEREACQKANKAQSFHKAWGALPVKARMAALKSTTFYLDAFTRQQIDIDTMETQFLALERERTVELSQTNAAMWTTLIGANVSQAAEFAAMGLTADHFEKILHLIGIFYIGHGVNK